MPLPAVQLHSKRCVEDGACVSASSPCWKAATLPTPPSSPQMASCSRSWEPPSADLNDRCVSFARCAILACRHPWSASRPYKRSLSAWQCRTPRHRTRSLRRCRRVSPPGLNCAGRYRCRSKLPTGSWQSSWPRNGLQDLQHDPFQGPRCTT